VDIQRRRLRAIEQLKAFAKGNEAFGQMSGLATRVVLRRQFELFGDSRFERLAGISNGHIYNLRSGSTYRGQRAVWTRTRAATVSIGLRQAPEAGGRPGFVPVDTVHQGTATVSRGSTWSIWSTR